MDPVAATRVNRAQVDALEQHHEAEQNTARGAAPADDHFHVSDQTLRAHIRMTADACQVVGRLAEALVTENKPNAAINRADDHVGRFNSTLVLAEHMLQQTGSTLKIIMDNLGVQPPPATTPAQAVAQTRTAQVNAAPAVTAPAVRPATAQASGGTALRTESNLNTASNRVQQDLRNMGLPAELTASLLEHVGAAVKSIQQDGVGEHSSVDEHMDRIKDKVCDLAIDQNSKLRNPNPLISAIADALPTVKMSSVSEVKSALQAVRTEGFFELLSTVRTPEADAVDPQERFEEVSTQVCQNTKTVLLEALPQDLVQELDLQVNLEDVDSISNLTVALKENLSNPQHNGNHATALRNQVNTIAHELVSDVTIPSHLIDIDALRGKLTDRVADLGFIEKIKQSNPVKAESELGKLCTEAVRQTMIGDVRVSHGNETVRQNSINNFVDALQIKGSLPTGDITRAAVCLGNPGTAFSGREILPHLTWNMSESGRRTFIAQQVVGVFQKVTRTTADPTKTLKKAFVSDGDLMEMLPEVAVKIDQYSAHLIAGVTRQLSGSHDVLRKLTFGAMAAAGVDSTTVMRHRDSTKAFQKPVVLTKQAMLKKSEDRPQDGTGLIKKMLRTKLSVERNDHAGRALVFHRRLQMGVAKALFQTEQGEVSLGRFTDLVRLANTNADLFNLASLAVVAAGDPQLASANGLELLGNMFELERNAAALPSGNVRDRLVERVRSLFEVDDQGAIVQDTGFAAQIVEGQYSGDFNNAVSVEDRPKGVVRMSPFASRNFRSAQQRLQVVQAAGTGVPPAADQGGPAGGAAAVPPPAAQTAQALTPTQRRNAITVAQRQMIGLQGIANALRAESMGLKNDLQPLSMFTRMRNPNNHNVRVAETNKALSDARVQARSVLGPNATAQDVEATPLVADARTAYDQAVGDRRAAQARLTILEGDDTQAGSVAEANRNLSMAQEQLRNLG